MTAGSLVAWKSSRSVRCTAVTGSFMGAEYPMVGWPASLSRARFGGGLDANAIARAGGPSEHRLAGSQAVDRRRDRVQLAAGGDGRAAEPQPVDLPVRGAQLHLDGDESGDADGGRGDAPAACGEEGQRPGGLLVALTALLLLGRPDGLTLRLGLGLGPGLDRHGLSGLG